jgi:hypothetical protein
MALGATDEHKIMIGPVVLGTGPWLLGARPLQHLTKASTQGD